MDDKVPVSVAGNSLNQPFASHLLLMSCIDREKVDDRGRGEISKLVRQAGITIALTGVTCQAVPFRGGPGERG